LENASDEENAANREAPLTRVSGDNVTSAKEFRDALGMERKVQSAQSRPGNKLLSSNVPNSSRMPMSIITVEYRQAAVREQPTPSMLRALLIPAETIHVRSPNVLMNVVPTTGSAVHNLRIATPDLESTLDLESELTEDGNEYGKKE